MKESEKKEIKVGDILSSVDGFRTITDVRIGADGKYQFDYVEMEIVPEDGTLKESDITGTMLLADLSSWQKV